MFVSHILPTPATYFFSAAFLPGAVRSWLLARIVLSVLKKCRSTRLTGPLAHECTRQIGGSLAKLVYFSREAHSTEPGGRLNFLSFETDPHRRLHRVYAPPKGEAAGAQWLTSGRIVRHGDRRRGVQVLRCDTRRIGRRCAKGGRDGVPDHWCGSFPVGCRFRES